MQGIGPGPQQCPDTAVRVAPGVLKWMTPLGLKSGPLWAVGPSGLAWDAMKQAEWGQLGYDISSGQGPQRRSPQYQQQQCLGQQMGQGKQRRQLRGAR